MANRSFCIAHLHRINPHISSIADGMYMLGLKTNRNSIHQKFMKLEIDMQNDPHRMTNSVTWCETIPLFPEN